MAAQLLLLAAGGAIGTVGRYLVSSLAFRWFHGAFPVGTLAVNLLGSLAAGFLWGWFERAAVPPHLRLFLLAGVLGGFTTFSASSAPGGRGADRRLEHCDHQRALSGDGRGRVRHRARVRTRRVALTPFFSGCYNAARCRTDPVPIMR
jgi:hypothetical protein